jgi:D-3-phosphoglycerate dehydrogenase / 2-oxoglutarate reductase
MKVLITTSSFGKDEPSLLDQLRSAGLDITLNPFARKLSEAEAIGLYPDHEYVIAGTEPVTRQVLLGAKSLRFLSRMGAGIDNLDTSALKELGIPWGYVTDSHVPAVAELALGGMLSVLRGIHHADRSIRSESWQKPMGRLLSEKTIGLIGLGKVAKHLVNLLKPFSVKIVATDIYADKEWAVNHGVELTDLNSLLQSANIVSLHVPGDDSTRNLIGQKELALMRKDAVLVNTSRGGVVDESALLVHLNENPDFAVFLDVFEQEPYAGPLKSIQTVLLTTHIGTYAREIRVIMERTCVEQVLNFHRRI